MKQKILQAIVAGMVLLLFMTGCGGQSKEEIKQGNVVEQDMTVELPVDSLADSPIESPMEGTTGTDIREADGEAAKSYNEMTTAEKIKTLTVEGCPLSLPFQVRDLGDGFSLRDGVSVDDRTTCEIVYKEKDLGFVSMSENLVASDYLTDMSTGYEDALIDTIDLSVLLYSVNFEIAGVTADSTLEEIVELWGEPDRRTEDFFRYYDINEETGEELAVIRLHFLQDQLLGVYLRLEAQENQ